MDEEENVCTICYDALVAASSGGLRAVGGGEAWVGCKPRGIGGCKPALGSLWLRAPDMLPTAALLPLLGRGGGLKLVWTVR